MHQSRQLRKTRTLPLVVNFVVLMVVVAVAAFLIPDESQRNEQPQGPSVHAVLPGPSAGN